MSDTGAVGIQRNILAKRVDIFHRLDVMPRKRNSFAPHTQLRHLEMRLRIPNHVIGVGVGLFVLMHMLQAQHLSIPFDRGFNSADSG